MLQNRKHELSESNGILVKKISHQYPNHFTA